MKKTILVLLSFCILNSLFAQWSYFSGTSGPIMYNGGNVGIGTGTTTSPGAALDVASGAVLARMGLDVRTNPSSTINTYLMGPTTGTQSCNMVIQANNGGGNAFWITGSNYYLEIGHAGGSEAVSPTISPINIDYTGNVGINTLNTSGYKFNCAGTAIFDQVTVANFSSNRPNATPWADFVFEKSYKLPSLDSVADFIQTNHHLPGIPTSQEVQKNGIDLGATDAQLLEKIEQLTLYTIDLQKQVETLKEENRKLSDLQTQIDALKASMATLARSNH